MSQIHSFECLLVAVPRVSKDAGCCFFSSLSSQQQQQHRRRKSCALADDPLTHIESPYVPAPAHANAPFSPTLVCRPPLSSAPAAFFPTSPISDRTRVSFAFCCISISHMKKKHRPNKNSCVSNFSLLGYTRTENVSDFYLVTRQNDKLSNWRQINSF